MLILVLIVLGSVVHRMLVDFPNIASGEAVPADEYDYRYAAYPWLAYLHIVPGVVYLAGAPLQLSHRFRSRHYAVHRRLGRIVLASGLLSGVFGVIFGGRYAYGGVSEAAATVVFSLWFIASLALAYRAIRGGDVVNHRRWMIRAFAMGIAVGTVRIWLLLLSGTGLLELRDAFGIAFWAAFLMHVAAAELWIRITPHPPDVRG